MPRGCVLPLCERRENDRPVRAAGRHRRPREARAPLPCAPGWLSSSFFQRKVFTTVIAILCRLYRRFCLRQSGAAALPDGVGLVRRSTNSRWLRPIFVAAPNCHFCGYNQPQIDRIPGSEHFIPRPQAMRNWPRRTHTSIIFGRIVNEKRTRWRSGVNSNSRIWTQPRSQACSIDL